MHQGYAKVSDSCIENSPRFYLYLSEIELIKVRYIIAVFAVILMSWVVGIYLTQQRIQMEADKKLQNVRQNITPFIWDFKSTNDIVSSFQKYWRWEPGTSTLEAQKGSNPRLSLNFSSELLNSRIHKRLEIISDENLDSRLVIQIKTDLKDDFYYYSSALKLKHKENQIDMDEVEWSGTNEQSGEKRKLTWGDKNQRIASIVLIFDNPSKDIVLERVSLPYTEMNLTESLTQIDCSAKTIDNKSILLSDINYFQPARTCLLPSVYMWLKADLQQKFPESILMLHAPYEIQETEVHKVNSFYTHITAINILLYCWLFTVVLFIYVFTRQASASLPQPANISSDNASVLRAYSVILIPSFLLTLAFLIIGGFEFGFLQYFLHYFIWAVLQQWILGFVVAEKIFFRFWQNKFVSAILASLLFSIMHLPSFTLFILTFIAGFFWSFCWLKYRKIIPLAVSHTLLALSFYSVVSPHILYSAKVLQWFWK